ncbi:hypothetical protein [Paenarthrobacter nitroguajacolicus]|uniref:hypothetical protein n=1 Tax=Paenarthrobacter nitroguajacolicus TaxID=211146 RepID=UPI00248ACC2D|nr:hypothetical protein [Paenarthrobacter nitroguajacolicus]MDI2033498.1 hypothetical protein [Paenarthrobacter nitroguajacolicus]
MRHPYRQAGAVIVTGSVVWLAGISPGSRVYLMHDPAERLRLLVDSERGWVIGHHFAAAGTAAVPMGVVAFAKAQRRGPAKAWASAGAAGLLAGAPLFIYSLSRRASDIERFASFRGSNAPFLGYSWLHVVGLAALGGSLLSSPAKRWVGIGSAGVAAVSGAVLATTKDIPPLVFYLTEGVVGAYLMSWSEPPDAGQVEDQGLSGTRAAAPWSSWAWGS